MSIFNIFKSEPKEAESKPEVPRDTTWDGAPEWANKKLRSGLEEYWANEMQYAPTSNPMTTSSLRSSPCYLTLIAERELSPPTLKYQMYTSEMAEEHSKQCAELRREAIRKKGMSDDEKAVFDFVSDYEDHTSKNKFNYPFGVEEILKKNQDTINEMRALVQELADKGEKPKRKPVHWYRETYANLAGYFDGEESGLRPSQILVRFLLEHNLIDEEVKDDVEKAVKLLFRHWHKDPWARQQIANTLKKPAVTLKGVDGTKHKIEDEIRIIINMTEKPFMTEKQAIDISSKGYIPMTVIKEHFCLVEG